MLGFQPFPLHEHLTPMSPLAFTCSPMIELHQSLGIREVREPRLLVQPMGLESCEKHSLQRRCWSQASRRWGGGHASRAHATEAKLRVCSPEKFRGASRRLCERVTPRTGGWELGGEFRSIFLEVPLPREGRHHLADDMRHVTLSA